MYLEKLHTQKFVVCFVLIGVVLVMVLCKFLSWNEMRITKIDVSETNIISFEDGARVFIDNAYYETDKHDGATITIDGWCVVLGKETNPVAIHVLLKNTSTGIYYELPTSIVNREDVTASFDDSINYDNSGFTVCIPEKFLAVENNTYSIFVLYEIDEEVYLIPSDNILASKEGADS